MIQLIRDTLNYTSFYTLLKKHKKLKTHTHYTFLKLSLWFTLPISWKKNSLVVWNWFPNPQEQQTMQE